MKIHENILVFGGDNYFPQMTPGEPYSKTSQSQRKPDVWGDFKRMGSNNDGTRYPKTIITFSNANQSEKIHPTQKPVALFEYLIRTYTQPGDLVLDPFVGSGTTALAARACGRDFVCGDMLLEYVEIARDRLRLPFEPRRVQQDTRLDDLPLFSMGGNQ